MLKKFFLNFLSSFAGAWIALVLFVAVAVVVTLSLVGKMGAGAASAMVESVSRHSVLKISLDGSIIERETPEDIDYMSLARGDIESTQTLDVLLKAISEAAVNKNIDMIYLEGGALAAGPATLSQLRDALVEFRKSGKRIYAYADNYSNASYYVASCADSIFVNKCGGVGLTGIGGTTLFMKDLFDKIGVEFTVVKVGTFKSAVEPYILNDMSAPARAQLDTLYGNMWSYIRQEIAESRKGRVTVAGIDTLINRDFIMLAEGDAVVKAGLVDRALYTRSVDDILASAVGVETKKLNKVSVSTLAAQTSQAALGSAYTSKRQLAVLFATGEIAEGVKGGIDCEKLVPEIVRLADDDNVKGMVLRVNSPGGSVFGSEQIGEALEYFKSKGKPLAVAMGDYAASGGYYISSGADKIFAQPLTLTGSIGIFGMIPCFNGLVTDKLGVNIDYVTTNANGAQPNSFYPMTPFVREKMQRMVERGYELFTSRCAEGRHLTQDSIKSIAEGRVWDGVTAHQIGLVDELGSLQDAIAALAKQMEYKKYEVVTYPDAKTDFWEMLSAFNSQMRVKALKEELGQAYPLYMQVKNLKDLDPLQARMEYQIIF